jgi:regulator of replication initiation timing
MRDKIKKINNITADIRDMQIVAECIGDYEQLQAENNTLKNRIGECVAILVENAELQAENERLTQEHKIMQDNLAQQVAHSVELTEALKKCIPLYDFGECETCGQVITEQIRCEFCRNDEEEGHANDCEYIRLIGGAG